jgi:hypothetical protein
LPERRPGYRDTTRGRDLRRVPSREQSHERHRIALLAGIATMAAGSIGYAATGRAGLALLAVLALGATLWALGRVEAHR